MRLVMYVLAVVLLVIGSAIYTHADVQDDGLIVYFSFDDAKGGTVKDGTGGGNDGKLDNAKISTKEKVHGNGSLECGEGNSSMVVDSFKELEDYQDNSYLFWLNFIEGNDGNWNQIIAKKAPGSDRSPGIWTCTNTLNIHWRFNPGNQGTHCSGPDGEGDQFETGDWHHLAGVKDGAKLIFYVDGEEIQENAVPKEHLQGGEKLYVGKTGYNSARFYIDDLYVYDRALSGKEVVNVMEGGLLPVEPQDKLSTTWGQLKGRRH